MKVIYLLLASAFLTGMLQAEFRTWTRNDGKTASLELIESKGEEDEKIGKFRMRNGRVLELPASDFIDSDADRINAWEPEPVVVAVTNEPSVFDSVLDGNLVKLDGKRLKSCKQETKPKKYYVFYYTASWCGPCQAFTPSLVSFYNKASKNNDNFELVLISSDSDAKAMEEYAKDKKMPWPQLKLSKAGAFKSKFNHGVNGIPAVIVCDLEGNIVERNGRDLNALGKLLK